MDTKKLKDGISVKELEHFAKKHRFEMFFCLALLLAIFFSFIFFSGWSHIAAGIGSIIGALLSDKIEMLFKKASLFIYKQEDLTQLILGIAGLILSVFLPMVTFLVLGAAGGVYLRGLVVETPSSEKETTLIDKE